MRRIAATSALGKAFALAALFLAMAVAGVFAQKRDFYELAQNGTLQEVQSAIAAGAKVNDIAGYANASILYFSALNKDSRVIAALLKAGADPNWKGIPGKPMAITPIEAAADAANPVYLKLLLAAGARPDFADSIHRLARAGRSARAARLGRLARRAEQLVGRFRIFRTR